jgi:hypothetical protein
MLKIMLKNKLNKKLRSQSLENFEIDNLIIKKGSNFTIYKEISTEVYILSIPTLLVIQYKYTKNLEDFLLLYAESDLHFDIYKNCNHYYAICVSKYKEDTPFDYKLWLTANESYYKYVLLTHFYDSFFVINKPWYNKKDKSDKFTFYKSVGNGLINDNIRNQLKMFIKMMNEMVYLPKHFLNF